MLMPHSVLSVFGAGFLIPNLAVSKGGLCYFYLLLIPNLMVSQGGLCYFRETESIVCYWTRNLTCRTGGESKLEERSTSIGHAEREGR